jgi:hypothetical protein
MTPPLVVVSSWYSDGTRPDVRAVTWLAKKPPVLVNRQAVP